MLIKIKFKKEIKSHWGVTLQYEVTINISLARKIIMLAILRFPKWIISYPHWKLMKQLLLCCLYWWGDRWDEKLRPLS
jgi:hypothetical protein